MRKDYNILITGASRGIGNAIAKRLVPYAKSLYVTSKNEDSLESGIAEIKKNFSGNLYCFSVDQSEGEKSADSLATWLNSVAKEIDVIILCAGNYFEGALCEINSKEFDNTINTNFLFNYYTVKK